ncbi:MAG TPA: cytochrome c-type biogenesis protein [Candidatus Limnocylindria bacterium]|nr:cytochrome c-type biogenesis protein [Candidatus Limnocylindria bacterium]
MTRSRGILVVAMLVVLAAVGWSARPHEPSAEERVDRITAELRCVVCQGLSVKDSPSESARQMREIVAQRVTEGRTDEEIRDEFRASYGDWVVLAPPIASWTGLIWLVPVAALVAGIAVAWRRLGAAAAAPPAATADEVAALRRRVARAEADDE